MSLNRLPDLPSPEPTEAELFRYDLVELIHSSDSILDLRSKLIDMNEEKENSERFVVDKDKGEKYKIEDLINALPTSPKESVDYLLMEERLPTWFLEAMNRKELR